MSRRDYELIAAMIAEHSPHPKRKLVLAFVEHFMENEERFDPVKFVQAALNMDDRFARRWLVVQGVLVGQAV